MAIQTLPDLWLFSDERNDAALEQALANLPRGSGFVFRHYHLEPEARRQRFEILGKIARKHGHFIAVSTKILADPQWHQDAPQGCLDGVYGALETGEPPAFPYLASAHDEAEIEAANSNGAAAVFISPVFATRSHPGSTVLGPEGFAKLAAKATMPAIALGGMTRERAAAMNCRRWGAIDGLAAPFP